MIRRYEDGTMEARSPRTIQDVNVYIAGPMRGVQEFNFPAFDEAADSLYDAGYTSFSPADHDRISGFDPTGLTGFESPGELGFNLRGALAADLEWLTQNADIICLLDGWEHSKGARAELATAAALGLRAGTLDQILSGEGLPDAADVLHDADLAYAREVEELRSPMAIVAVADDPPNLDPNRTVIIPRLNDLASEIYQDRLDRQNAETEAFSAMLNKLPPEVRVTSATGGEKGDKLARFDLIPTGPLWKVAELYGRGAKKYAERNWERGYDWHLSYAAMMRHANAFWSGVDVDAETGAPHLASVVFHALALMEYGVTHPEFDDRPKNQEVAA